MSVKLLRQIAAMPLPNSFNTKRDVDAVKVLREAGWVLALIDEPPELGAKVFALTAEGREALLRIHYPVGPSESRAAAVALSQVGMRVGEGHERSIGA